MTPALSGDNAVPFRVPARFLLTGALALAVVWTSLALRPDLVVGPYGAPGVLAAVHGLTLAFGSMVLVGAMHQMIPVLMVTRLARPGWGGATYALLAAGSAGVIGGFAAGVRVLPLALGGATFLAGLLVFATNLALTTRSAHRVDAVGRAMLLSVAFLILTVVLGVAVALGRVLPSLAAGLGYVTPLHVGLGLAGAFFTAVAGAGHKLLSMFVLTHGVGPARLNALSACVGGGLASLALHAFAGVGGVVLPSLAVAALGAASVLFALDVRAILRARMRRRIEPALRTYLAGVAVAVAVVGLLIAGRVPEAVAAMLLGFLPLTIAGMLLKITGFLAWQHRYAGRIGRGGAESVPMLADMLRPGLARVTAVGLASGAALAVAARLASAPSLAAAGALAGAAGAWALVAHLAWIVFGAHVASRPAPAKGATA